MLSYRINKLLLLKKLYAQNSWIYEKSIECSDRMIKRIFSKKEHIETLNLLQESINWFLDWINFDLNLRSEFHISCSMKKCTSTSSQSIEKKNYFINYV